MYGNALVQESPHQLLQTVALAMLVTDIPPGSLAAYLANSSPSSLPKSWWSWGFVSLFERTKWVETVMVRYLSFRYDHCRNILCLSSVLHHHVDRFLKQQIVDLTPYIEHA